VSARPLVCIVEGQGECAALPVLVGRMLTHLRRERRLAVDESRIICTKDGSRIVAPYDPVRQLGVEYFAARAAREKPAAILTVVDAEERCVKRQPGEPPLGPWLLERARSVVGGIPVGVVVANRMFETWFLADFQSLRDRGRFLADADYPDWQTPEQTGGCKGWMKIFMGRTYSETRDQVAFAGDVTLPLSPAMQRRAPSYWKLLREVDRLSREVAP